MQNSSDKMIKFVLDGYSDYPGAMSLPCYAACPSKRVGTKHTNITNKIRDSGARISKIK